MDSLLEKRFYEYLEFCGQTKFSTKKNVVFGNPDFYYKKTKLAFFIDGDMFHNKKIILSKKTRSLTFRKRLIAGLQRDKIVNKRLTQSGWIVVRVSESEVKNHPEYCINLIKKTIRRCEN